jgi:hypothetical protein
VEATSAPPSGSVAASVAITALVYHGSVPFVPASAAVVVGAVVSVVSVVSVTVSVNGPPEIVSHPGSVAVGFTIMVSVQS